MFIFQNQNTPSKNLRENPQNYRGCVMMSMSHIPARFLYQTGRECDRPARNKNIINHTKSGQAMEQADYKQYITTAGKFRVILEYPQESKEEEATLKEVREVLNHLLREQLAK